MTTVESAAPAPGAVHPGGKFLTFFLAGEEYGVEILKVHEIIGMLPVTRVPRTPAHVRGVINLRGKVIPVVDLRAKFGMPPAEASGVAETCIVVVQIRGVQTGVVVDRVSEVAHVAGADIEPAPAFGADVPTDFLLGIGKSQPGAGQATAGITLLLDIDRVLSAGEAGQLGETAQAAQAGRAAREHPAA